jgi:hypothetical protein
MWGRVGMNNRACVYAGLCGRLSWVGWVGHSELRRWQHMASKLQPAIDKRQQAVAARGPC